MLRYFLQKEKSMFWVDFVEEEDKMELNSVALYFMLLN